MSPPIYSAVKPSACLCAYLMLWASPLVPKDTPLSPGPDIYETLKQFRLSGATALVENLTLKRDRVEITFSGTFYFEQPVSGRIRGVVFLGRGSFHAEPPPSEFERENLVRMLKADVVESDFRTAVLRFTDDTPDTIGKVSATATQDLTGAQELATDFQKRLLKETGANVAARVAVSILNQEQPGFFLAQFDKGRRGRFTFVLDHQGRLPASTFEINGGEKGLIFASRGSAEGTDIWMVFYSLEDYARSRVEYTDVFDLVSVRHYTMQVDVHDPKKVLKVEARLDMQSLINGLRSLPLRINESLGEHDSVRLKKALRLKAARLADGSPLQAVQEDWEGGVTLFFSAPRARDDKFSAVMEFEGDFMYDSSNIADCFYPRETGSWYPRHGYLNRSTFDLTFRHDKHHRVAAVGVRVREALAPENDSEMVTEWKMEMPVALVTFGVGRFERHTETAKREEGDLPLEFYSLPGGLLAIKEDFILAEMSNSVRYFSALFGPYPYPQFGAVFHPRSFGQGFATMLLLPKSDSATKHTFAFIAHETSHQWWGNVVAWRSYRDQWLSEGFAEYSGVLYTGRREKPAEARELLEELRRSLVESPQTEQGIGKGHVADIGPLILGHRLSTRETQNAYTTLIYNKGALVLRMLHFLFTDPQTGDSKLFFDMMREFVRRYRGGSATTENFMQVAGEHFARTPIAQKYRLQNLSWFFGQWVYQAYLPTYVLEYSLEDQPDGSVILKGTINQDNTPKEWFMPLPVVFRFGKNQAARGTIHAYGPKTPVAIKLPGRPSRVELDPELWVLSEKTTTKSLK